MAEQRKPSEQQEVVITTVPRAYLKPKDLQKFSMWHTSYVADPIDKTRLHRLEIVGGVIRNLPLATYERFAAAGILTTERPRRVDDDE